MSASWKFKLEFEVIMTNFNAPKLRYNTLERKHFKELKVLLMEIE